MKPDKAQELAEKMKSLNQFFATMITKINQDIHLLENTLHESRTLISKPASIQSFKKPYIEPQLINSWQQPRN